MNSPPHHSRLKAILTRVRRGFEESVPTRESLAQSAFLRPIASHVLDPALWRRQRESVARGVAIGVFWAFVIPFAQILFAAAHCVWWRANIPVAAAITFITNPFTVGFWLWLAYKLGSLMIDAPPPVMPNDGAGLMAWLSAIGWPAVLGMGIFAVGGSSLGYVLVNSVWRLRDRRRRQRLMARRRMGVSGPKA